METPSHQEWRSRQRVSWNAIAKTAAIAGAILFVMSGGSPWSTAGTMNAIMGRDLPVGFVALVFFHFLTAYLYVTAIAHTTYRLRLMPALAVGVITGLALYAVNYFIFFSLPLQMQSPENRALFVHVSFGLMAAAVYKGMSVPRPFGGGSEQVRAQSTEAARTAAASDPEPLPAAADEQHG